MGPDSWVKLENYMDKQRILDRSDFDLNHFLHDCIFVLAPCPEPTAPTNGVVKLTVPPIGGELYEVGSTVLFACDNEHKLDESAVAECQLYGTWSSVTPTCKIGNFHFPQLHIMLYHSKVGDITWSYCTCFIIIWSKVFFSLFQNVVHSLFWWLGGRYICI